MGFWGYYDHESDSSSDAFNEIIIAYLLKFKPLYKIAFNEQFIKKEAFEFMLKIESVTKQKKDKKFMNFVSNYVKKIKNPHWSDITGVAMFLVLDKNRNIPNKLPINFPKWLQKKSCKTWIMMLKNREEHIDSFVNPKERENAIIHMMTLFSC